MNSQVLINSDPVDSKCWQILSARGVWFLNCEVGHFSEIGTTRS